MKARNYSEVCDEYMKKEKLSDKHESNDDNGAGEDEARDPQRQGGTFDNANLEAVRCRKLNETPTIFTTNTRAP